MEAKATQENDGNDGLLVIGAGLPRTGTMSLQKALTELYDAKCYHMTDVLQGDQEDIDVWVDAMDGKMTPTKWHQYFKRKNYATGVDFPLARFYKELMVAFPSAKVVMSTRDPATWHGSVYSSIYQLTRLMTDHWSYGRLIQTLDGRKNCGKHFFQKIDSKVAPGCDVALYDAIRGGPEMSEKFFLDWETEVKKSVPADRLLVHSAKEGWAPLCNFLGLPIPDRPYPRVNDTASIQRATRTFQIVHGVVFYIAPLLTAVAGFMLKDTISQLLYSAYQIISGLWSSSDGEDLINNI